MAPMMKEPCLSGETFYELTAIGSSEKVGTAKVDADGIAYKLGNHGWRVFPGGKMGLEDSFDLHQVVSDPSLDMAGHRLPPRK